MKEVEKMNRFLLIGLILLLLVGNSNAASNNDVILDEENHGIEDYDTFTPASKIAFEDMNVLGVELLGLDIPSHMHTFGDLVTFLTSIDFNAVASTITKDKLKVGDIVQLKNSDSAFLVYVGTNNSNGNILLEDINSRYECSPKSFDLLFTGNAILIDHTALDITPINGDNVNDNPIYDSNIHLGPSYIGNSTTISSMNLISYNYTNGSCEIGDCKNCPIKMKVISSDYRTSRSKFTPYIYRVRNGAPAVCSVHGVVAFTKKSGKWPGYYLWGSAINTNQWNTAGTEYKSPYIAKTYLTMDVVYLNQGRAELGYIQKITINGDNIVENEIDMMQ